MNDLVKIYQTYTKKQKINATKIDRAFLRAKMLNYDLETCSHCRDHVFGTSCKITDAPIYVTSVDTFFSGWGYSKGRKNLVVVPCSTMEEANSVIEYIRNKRTDQKNIRIVLHKPKSETRNGESRLLTQMISWRYHALHVDAPMPTYSRIGKYIETVF